MSYYDTLRYKAVIYGDGHVATLIDQKAPYYDRLLQLTMVEMLVVPSSAMIEQYGISSSDLNVETSEGRGKWVKCWYYYVHHLTYSQTYGVVLVACSYDGQDTEVTKLHEKLYNWIKVIDQENKSHQEMIYKLSEDNAKLRTRQIELLKELKDMEKIVYDKGDTNQNGGDFIGK